MEIKSEWVNIEIYERKDLLRYVLAHCVCIGELTANNSARVREMQAWCEREFGESRDGNIISEAMEGWLDYFDGDWCYIYDDLHNTGDWVFWFSRTSDKVQFELTWLGK